MPSLSLGLGFARGPVVSGPPGLPLDGFSPAFAYSAARRLRTSYTGALVRLRRSSDNVEQDIGYNGSNELDTAAITTFIGSNSAFLVTLYDQSGNARHMSQSTAAAQPRVVNAGTLEVRNGKASPFFDGTDDFLINTTPTLYAAGAATIFAVVSFDSTAPVANRRFYSEGSTASANQAYIVGNSIDGNTTLNFNDLGVFIRNDANTVVLEGTTVGSEILVDAVNNTNSTHITFVDAGNEMRGHSGGGTASTRAYTRSGSLTLDRAGIGAFVRTTGASGFWQGRISEMVGFTSALSSSNLTTIGQNQGTFYGITVNPF